MKLNFQVAKSCQKILFLTRISLNWQHCFPPTCSRWKIAVAAAHASNWSSSALSQSRSLPDPNPHASPYWSFWFLFCLRFQLEAKESRQASSARTAIASFPTTLHRARPAARVLKSGVRKSQKPSEKVRKSTKSYGKCDCENCEKQAHTEIVAKVIGSISITRSHRCARSGATRMMSLTVLSLPQRFKRILQAMMLAVAVVYMTLLLYQSAYGYPGIQVSSVGDPVRYECVGAETENLGKNCHTRRR